MNKELLQIIDGWQRSGLAVAVATAFRVEGSSPLPPGAALAVNEKGEVAGSVSGGCVESALYRELQEILGGGQARTLVYGVSDDTAFSVGLTCGGTLHVYAHLLDGSAPVWRQFFSAVRSETPVTLLTVLDGAGKGTNLTVTAEEFWGSTGIAELDRLCVAEARGALRAARTTLRQVCVDGNQEGSTLFLEPFAPAPRFLVLGATDHAAALVRMAKYMGYRVTLVDARSVFATRTRFPDADEIVVAWPHEYLEETRVAPGDAICVMSHDEKFDIPALLAALRTPAAYIGAMGSRRTHDRRIRELRETGVTQAELDRLSSPIGLDLGGRTPEETAISIAAEIVALRHGRSGDRLSRREGAIHSC